MKYALQEEIGQPDFFVGRKEELADLLKWAEGTKKKVSKELQPYISGVFTTEDGDYALFDTSRLLTDAAFTEASAITTN